MQLKCVSSYIDSLRGRLLLQNTFYSQKMEVSAHIRQVGAPQFSCPPVIQMSRGAHLTSMCHFKRVWVSHSFYLINIVQAIQGHKAFQTVLVARVGNFCVLSVYLRVIPSPGNTNYSLFTFLYYIFMFFVIFL